MNQEYELGVIGLGTMGRNLLLNIADHRHWGIGLDRDMKKVDLMQREAKAGKRVCATSDVKVFAERLRQPRAIIMLLPAGPAVDEVIEELLPLLKADDILIDAGNSHFTDTDAREKYVQGKGIHFLGIGVSGGELGARNGPSIMPGGPQAAYDRLRPVLEAISAHVGEDPCVTYLGPGSAGHYVKMVHNGIEYALMQLIAETYAFLKNILKLSDDECHEVYTGWNCTELSSYLLEITGKIFLKKDENSEQRLIDFVLDAAKQNGTGMWTSQEAMVLQTPVPTIDAAVTVRDLSSQRAERQKASSILNAPTPNPAVDRKACLRQLRNAYYVGTIIAFAQGMALLKKASEVHQYQLNLESIAKIWRGGCIIRAALLEPIMTAYRKNPTLSNLLLDAYFVGEIEKHHADMRSIIQVSSNYGMPIPALMASLAYYDVYRSAWLPTNLIQAQRDFFGAHTYERIDTAGTFHSEWESP